MSNILFKKGSYNQFEEKVLGITRKIDPATGALSFEQGPKNIQEGALYLTEDEGGLYIGGSENTIKRIQGSVIFYSTLTEFSNSVKPPFSTDVIYFITANNALLHWNATKEWKDASGNSKIGGWDQLNTSFAADIADLQDQIDDRPTLDEVNTLIAGLSHATTKDIADLIGTNADALFDANGNIKDLTLNALANACDDLYTKCTNLDAELDEIPDIKDRLDAIDGATGELVTIKESIKEVKETAEDALELGQGALQKTGGTMSGSINMGSNYITRLATNTNDRTSAVTFGYLDDELSDIADTLAGKLDLTGGTMTGDINMGANTVTGLKNPTNGSDAVPLAYFEAALNDVVSASDALVFKGILSSTNGLPTSGYGIGDTYKVGENYTYEGIAAKVGDLIVRIPDGESSKWDLIPSGDELSYIQQLTIDDTNNYIYLTDGVNSDAANAKGGIQLVSACDNLTIDITEPASGNTLHKVTVSLTWDTFDV